MNIRNKNIYFAHHHRNTLKHAYDNLCKINMKIRATHDRVLI